MKCSETQVATIWTAMAHLLSCLICGEGPKLYKQWPKHNDLSTCETGGSCSRTHKQAHSPYTSDMMLWRTGGHKMQIWETGLRVLSSWWLVIAGHTGLPHFLHGRRTGDWLRQVTVDPAHSTGRPSLSYYRIPLLGVPASRGWPSSLANFPRAQFLIK